MTKSWGLGLAEPSDGTLVSDRWGFSETPLKKAWQLAWYQPGSFGRINSHGYLEEITLNHVDGTQLNLKLARLSEISPALSLAWLMEYPSGAPDDVIYC